MDAAIHGVARVRLRRRPDRRSGDQSPIVSTQDIARRGYELFLERGGEHGRDVEDWLRAESEMTAARRRA